MQSRRITRASDRRLAVDVERDYGTRKTRLPLERVKEKKGGQKGGSTGPGGPSVSSLDHTLLTL